MEQLSPSARHAVLQRPAQPAVATPPSVLRGHPVKRQPPAAVPTPRGELSGELRVAFAYLGPTIDYDPVFNYILS